MPDQLQTEASPSITSLVSGIVEDAQRLIRQEFALAKSEVKEEWSKTKTAAASLSVAVGLAVLGIVLLSLMLVYLLNWLTNNAVPLWGCFGIFGGLICLCALILYFAGKNQAEKINVVPRQTVETMRENVQWIKNQT